MELQNKVAIITGAGRGIGKAIALNLAQEGTHVALVARTEKELAATAFCCEQYGVMAKFYPFDLTTIDGIPALIQKIKKDFRQIHILVNDAGRYEEGDPVKSDLREWDFTLDLNFKAIYHLTQEVLRVFPEKDAAIINISSISAMTVSHGGEIYNASKAALKSYAGCLYEDVRERGIKVTTIYPGYVNTDMNSHNPLDHSKMIQPGDIASAVNWALKLAETSCPTDIIIRPQRSPSRSAAA